MYFIKCFMPNDRTVYFDHNNVIKEVNNEIGNEELNIEEELLNTYEFNVLLENDIELHMISNNEFQNIFKFNYSSRLIFLHEKELRNIPLKTAYSLENETKDNNIIDILNKGKIITGVSIRFINNEFGYGLFADRIIEINEIIGEYTGVVTSNEQSSTGDYSMNYPNGDGSYSINAFEYGNICRFINHSTVNPLIEFKRIYHNSLPHVICIVTSQILLNQEITVNYNPSFWVTRDNLIDV